MARARISQTTWVFPDGASTETRPTPGQTDTPVTVTVPVAAAADSSLPLKTWVRWYTLSVALALVAFIVSYVLLLPDCQAQAACKPTELYKVSSDFNMFAGLFVLALAVERLLEPLSRFIGPNTEEAKDERDKAQVAAERDPDGELPAPAGVETPGDDAPTNIDWLASAQSNVDQARQIGSIVHWGVAVGLSFVLSAKLNVLLLGAIAAKGSAQPSPWADLLVTGLVVGAGTKPLHDLVSKLEKSKNKAQDPASTGGSVQS